MSKPKLRRAIATILVLSGVLMFAVADGSSGSLTLTLDRGAEGIQAGEPVGGVADDPECEIVEVRMYVDGVLVETDETMEGPGHNEFEFVIPADAGGKTVTIEALNSHGDVLRESYRVRPAR